MPPHAQLCECGYGLATGALEAVHDRIRRDRTHGTVLQLRGGLLLLSFLPTLWIFSFMPTAVLALAPFIFMFQLVAGTTSLTHGGRLARAAQRKLRAARQLSQLPAARLIER